MTISTTTNQIAYVGDGISLAFAFPYPFITTADLKVYVAGVLQTSGYSVAGVAPVGGSGTFSTGTVTFAAPPAAVASVLIYCDPDLLQSSALPPNDPFPSKTVEKMIDKLTLLVQRIYGKFGNAITFPVGETTNGVLPAAAARANKLASFDASGNVVAVASNSQDATSVSIALAAFIALVASSAGSAQVGYIQAGAGAVTRTTQAKLRETRISVMDFGAKGDGTTDDTAAIQVAINLALLATNPGTYLSNSPANGSPIVFFPSGYYKVTSTLQFTNHVAFEGEGQSEFSSGSRIFQATGNTDLFNGVPLVGGTSVSFEKLTLKALAAGTGTLVRLHKNTGSYNSVRFKDMTFGQPQNTAVQIDSGDDVVFDNVLWDVGLTGATQAGIVLGTTTAGEVCSNVRFINCNWFEQQLACIKVVRVDGLTTTGCTAYTDGGTRTQFFLDATSALQCDNINLGPMKHSYGRCLASLNNSNNVTISPMVCQLMGVGAGETLSMIRMFGTCDMLTILGVTASGQYDTKSYYDDSGATAVTRANIQINTFKNNGGTGPAVVCGKTTGKIRNNQYTGFIQASVGAPFTTTGSSWAPGTPVVTLTASGASVPCVGARPGDRLEITPVGAWPVSQLLVLSPQVNSNDQATIAYGNPSAGNIAAAAHDWQFEVQR